MLKQLPVLIWEGEEEEEERRRGWSCLGRETSLPGPPRKPTDARHRQEAAVRHSSLASTGSLCSLRTALLPSGFWRFG